MDTAQISEALTRINEVVYTGISYENIKYNTHPFYEPFKPKSDDEIVIWASFEMTRYVEIEIRFKGVIFETLIPNGDPRDTAPFIELAEAEEISELENIAGKDLSSCIVFAINRDAPKKWARNYVAAGEIAYLDETREFADLMKGRK